MKKLKSFLAAALVALMSAVLIVPIAACNPEETVDGNSVYVTSLGGMPLKDVTVELLNGSASLGLKKTDEEGKVSYDLDGATTYTANLSGVPAGFEYNSNYTVKGSDEKTYIRLNSQVIESGRPANTYVSGDVMYDFEQTYYSYDDAAKDKLSTKTVKLSDLFKDGKKAVMINMFYNGCSACVAEYPALSAAYKKYSDKLEILAINDYPDTATGESLNDLKSLVVSDKVPYLMCKDNAGVGVWFKGISKGLYPTSIMIDRYGIVAETLVGNQTNQQWWEDWFKKYTDDNYTQGDITQGDTGDEVLIPDKPGDFGAKMPTTQELNAQINKTGRNVVFSANTDNVSSGWPWDFTADKSAIYPTNTGHRGTFAVMYAQIDLKAGEVFAFDYKLSTEAETDYFYVSLDSRIGTGRQLTMTSGVQDWQTGFAYVALEDGRHEIEFTYFRSSSNSPSTTDDKVYVNNLRITTVAEMNAALTAKNETLEIPYFATRNLVKNQFSIYENVYLANDGYYHVGTKANEKASDPYLMLDLTHSVPYFGSNSSSINTLYSSEMSNKGGLMIGNEDYSDTFLSYISFSSNSLYTGLIPVNEDVKEVISKFYNDRIPSDRPYWNENGWLQFCVSYRQYGVQKELTDPVKGLAYFSAFDAKETTDVSEATYKKVTKGTGQFILEKGIYIDVEGTSRENEGEYDYTDNINQVHFDRIIMPLGYLYKFVPTKTGVYKFQGIDCYYINETDTEEAILDSEDTDAALYSGDLKISHAYSPSLVASTSDRYDRNEVSNSFKIAHYLEKGETYYLSVNFRVVETTGDFAFRVDYMGETYSYISQAASNFYVPDNSGKIELPLYCEPAFDNSHTYSYDGETFEQVWYDKKGGGLIYLDFTQRSSMFNSCTVEQVLDDGFKSAQFTFDISKKTYIDDEGVEYDISLDLEKMFGGAENIPDCLKGRDIKDYTEIMRKYLELSKKVDKNDPYYGLLPVNDEIYGIIQLYNAKFLGYDTPDEWLRACCYTVVLGA